MKTEIIQVEDSGEELQNTGPLLMVHIREWLGGSAVAVVLEKRDRYIRE